MSQYNSMSPEVLNRRAGFKARGSANRKWIVGSRGWKLEALADFRGRGGRWAVGWSGAGGGGWHHLRFAAGDMS